jgi:C4-dicarboxylate-specific signal transduction histidine kinase
MDDIVKYLSTSDTFLNELLEISRISALEEMASGMAHELAQPLGAIATFSNAAERMLNRPEPLVARALDVLSQISHEALTAGERLQGIRHLFAQPRIQQTRCQMSDILAEVRPVLDSAALRVNVGLRVDLPAALPDVRVDRLRIEHVLLALVKNAVDASASIVGERVVSIDVSAQRYTVETGISDLGDGVSPEVEAKLFRAFFTTKEKGTGLGLASCRAIIESHDGTIGFQNVPTGGVRFWFRLPIAQD